MTSMDRREMNVIIFGVGYHGRMAYRSVKENENKYKIIGFCDNNKLKHNKKLFNETIYSVKDTLGMNVDKYILAGRGIKLMKSQLLKYGKKDANIILFGRDDILNSKYNFKKRSSECEKINKIIIKILNDLGINYWFDYSSLLALLRCEEFGMYSDMDITVESNKLNQLFAEVKRYKQTLNIDYSTYHENNGLYKKDEIKRIVITKSSVTIGNEPAIIDINPRYFKDAYSYSYLSISGGEYEVKSSIDHFKGHEIIHKNNIDYKIPMRPTHYLEKQYGNTWSKEVKYWYNDSNLQSRILRSNPV